MRNIIIGTTIAALIFAAVSVVNSQNNSTTLSRQLLKGWVQSSQNDDKPGLVEGNAVLIFDGDTIGVVTKTGLRYTIRLRGIDAPENRQPFGTESANQLAYLVQGMNVVAIVGEPDMDNRYVGAVFIDGEDVSLTQIRKGMAWSFSKTSTSLTKEQRDAFKRAEDSARTEKLGLWASLDPIAPWIFRGESVEKPEPPKETTGRSAATTKAASASGAMPNTVKPPPNTGISRKYILGPRGGCYYLNDQGVKVYVRNKDLCTKQ